MPGLATICSMRANFETGLKICSVCKIEQPIKNFYSSKQTVDKLNVQCKKCRRITIDKWRLKNESKIRVYQSVWYKENPFYNTDRKRLRKFGISSEGVQILSESQNNKCPGCLRNFVDLKRNCVDHDHITNKVRGILCWECNISLGHLHDNPATLRRLANYLEAHCG